MSPTRLWQLEASTPLPLLLHPRLEPASTNKLLLSPLSQASGGLFSYLTQSTLLYRQTSTSPGMRELPVPYGTEPTTSLMLCRVPGEGLEVVVREENFRAFKLGGGQF